MEIIYSDRDLAVCIKPVGLDSENEVPGLLKESLGGESEVEAREAARATRVCKPCQWASFQSIAYRRLLKGRKVLVRSEYARDLE